MFKKFLGLSLLSIILGIIISIIEGLLFGICLAYVWNNFIVNFSESLPVMSNLVGIIIAFLISFIFTCPKVTTNK